MNCFAGRRRAGFTVTEIVITVAVGGLILGIVGFLAVRWIEDRQLEATAKTLASYLRTAEARAIQSEGGADQGVSRAGGRLTLFRGSTYATRQTAYDAVFPYPGYISFSGLTEVDFSRQSGAPSATGTFAVTNGRRTGVITVYSTGAVSGP